ncbi:MAG: phosphonate ABC transporter, permease protein PhnE [Anaerolineae bacterium]
MSAELPPELANMQQDEEGDIIMNPIRERNPLVTAAMGIVPGLGHFYFGRPVAGILYLISGIFMVLLLLRVGAQAEFDPFGQMFARDVERYLGSALLQYLLIAFAVLFWVWQAAAAALKTAGRRRAAPVVGAGALIGFTYLLGFQATEVDLEKFITEFPDTFRIFTLIIWPWEQAVQRDEILLTAQTNWLTPCAGDPPEQTREGDTWITLDPACGEIAAFSLEEARVVPGTQLTATGSGFDPGVPVELWWILQSTDPDVPEEEVEDPETPEGAPEVEGFIPNLLVNIVPPPPEEEEEIIDVDAVAGFASHPPVYNADPRIGTLANPEDFEDGQTGSIEIIPNEEGMFEVTFGAPQSLPTPDEGPYTYVWQARQTEALSAPRISDDFRLAVDRMVVTIFQALMATSLGIIFAVPVSFLAARNLMFDNPITRIIYYVVRFLLNVVRSIEPIIWGVIAIAWVGLGPFAGVMALMIHTIAALGKLYSESIESIDAGPIEAITATGATRLQTILFAIVPQIVPPYISFTLYRWDINVRMSTIIGFVGGGGIGQILFQWINQSRWGSAGMAVWLIAITVSVLDYASSELRKRFV